MVSLLVEKGATRQGFRSRIISSKLPFLHFDTLYTYFSLFVSVFELSFDLCHSLFLWCFLMVLQIITPPF